MKMKYGVCMTTGKVTYRTRKMAWEASLTYFIRLGTFAGVYKCKYCKKYHLSKKVRTAPPSIIKRFDKWFHS